MRPRSRGVTWKSTGHKVQKQRGVPLKGASCTADMNHKLAVDNRASRFRPSILVETCTAHGRSLISENKFSQ
jgi:hypothetical protein